MTENDNKIDYMTSTSRMLIYRCLYAYFSYMSNCSNFLTDYVKLIFYVL